MPAVIILLVMTSLGSGIFIMGCVLSLTAPIRNAAEHSGAMVDIHTSCGRLMKGDHRMLGVESGASFDHRAVRRIERWRRAPAQRRTRVRSRLARRTTMLRTN
jgi:hypothetical protein